MKKLKIALLMIVAVMFILPSCKKGANDPFISLKSRDAKITAVWKLTAIESTQTSVSGGTSTTTTTTYDGTTYTATSGGSSNSGIGTFEMTIDKDGVMSVSESFTYGGSTEMYSSTGGAWGWLNSDTKKMSVLLNGGGNYLFYGGLYVIDRLSGKELVLTSVSTSNDNGDTDSYDAKYTFEKQ